MPELCTRVENRQEWFCLIIAYLKMRAYILCLDFNPQTSPETFDQFIWPSLLDQMFTRATVCAFETVAAQIILSIN